jgi:hypothetical protein
MQDWLEQFWDVFKIVAPWLTGGVAGATLTYLLNQRAARRKQARVLVTTERVDYSLAAKDDQLKALRVSYCGTEYDSLLFYRFTIDNVSTRTVQKSPTLFIFDDGTEIVYRGSVLRPVNQQTPWVQLDGHTSAYIWDAGELKPGDSARLSLLLTPATSLNWSWRGDDDVEVTSFGREATSAIERDLRNVVAWVALYVFFGSFPLFSGAAQSILIIATMPFIVPYCVRLWSTVFARKRDLSTVGTVNAAHGSRVAFVVGAGTAMVPADTDMSAQPDTTGNAEHNS